MLSDRRAQSFHISGFRSADCHKRLPDTKMLNSGRSSAEFRRLSTKEELTLKQLRQQRQNAEVNRRKGGGSYESTSTNLNGVTPYTDENGHS